MTNPAPPGTNGVNFDMHGDTHYQSGKGCVPRDLPKGMCHRCGKIGHNSWDNIRPNAQVTLNKMESEKINNERSNTEGKEDKDEKWNAFSG